jgi:hypothetical protein
MAENADMAHRLLASIILLGASLAAAGPVLAQAPAAPASPATSPAGPPTAPGADSSAPTQSPPAPSAPAGKPATAPAATSTTTPSEPAASPPPAAPSADTLKKARLAGYHPESRKGITMYCQETANVGTRFPTKKCIDESQLKAVMDVHNDQADSLRQPGACTGAVCTGH